MPYTNASVLFGPLARFRIDPVFADKATAWERVVVGWELFDAERYNYANASSASYIGLYAKDRAAFRAASLLVDPAHREATAEGDNFDPSDVGA